MAKKVSKKQLAEALQETSRLLTECYDCLSDYCHYSQLAAFDVRDEISAAAKSKLGELKKRLTKLEARRPFEVAAATQQLASTIISEADTENYKAPGVIIKQRCVVCGYTAAGEPGFVGVVVTCTNDDLQSGRHYEEAIDAAMAGGFDNTGAFVVFDEHDCPSWLQKRFDWSRCTQATTAAAQALLKAITPTADSQAEES